MKTWFIVLALLVAAVPGCKDRGGGAADLTAPDMASICPGAPTDACGTCMAGACCDAASACLGDADCAACVRGEDADACERTPETHERVNAYLVCRGGDCRDACIGPSGASCVGETAGLVTTACQACLEASCCEEVAACRAYDGCWVGCFTDFSATACHGDPDGHALFHALGSCVSSACDTICN